MADWLVPLEVTRGAALAWVAAVGGNVAAASRDRLVAVKLGRERDGGDGGDAGDEGDKMVEKEEEVAEKDTMGEKTTKTTDDTAYTTKTTDDTASTTKTTANV